jgi:hypothetical protein
MFFLNTSSEIRKFLQVGSGWKQILRPPSPKKFFPVIVADFHGKFNKYIGKLQNLYKIETYANSCNLRPSAINAGSAEQSHFSINSLKILK